MQFDNQIDPNELFMGTIELMQITGLDRNQIRAAIHNKKLNHVIVAGKTLYYRQEVNKFANALKNGAKVSYA